MLRKKDTWCFRANLDEHDTNLLLRELQKMRKGFAIALKLGTVVGDKFLAVTLSLPPTLSSVLVRWFF